MMFNLDNEGFLRGRVETWSETTREKHALLTEKAESLNRLCHEFLDERSIDLGDERQKTVSVLFVRMMELYQGVLILCFRGMDPSSAILFRGLTEAHFHFEAIRKDENYLNDFLNQIHIQQIRVARGIKNSDLEELGELRALFDEEWMSQIEQRKAESGARKVTIEQVAKRGGHEATYRVAYPQLSNIAHSSASSLESHVIWSDESGEIVGFRYGPSDSHFTKYVGLASVVMADALSELYRLHGEPCPSEVGEIMAQVETELRKVSK
jgi:hypothetical protein